MKRCEKPRWLHYIIDEPLPMMTALSILMLIPIFFCENGISGIASMGLYVFSNLFLLYSVPQFVLKYFCFVLYAGLNILGCFVIEYSSVNLYELATTSHYAGSLPLLVASRWAIFPALYSFDRRFGYCEGSSDRIESSRKLDYVSVAVLIITAIAFVSVVDKPAFVLGVDRFEHAKLEGQSALIRKIASYLNILVIFPLLSIKRGNKHVGYATIAIYLLYLLWVGHKFGGILSVLIFALMVFNDKFQSFETKKLRIILLSMVVSSIALVGLAVGMEMMTGGKGTSSFEYLGNRLSQQGQLWWRMFDEYDAGPHAEEFVSDVQNQIFAGGDEGVDAGEDCGIYRIMYLSAPEDIIDAKLDRGSLYAEAGYAAALYYGGVAGPFLFSAISCLVIGVVVNTFLMLISKDELIGSLLLARLFTVCRDFVGTFLLTDFISKSSILSYALLLFLACMGRLKASGRLGRVDWKFK